MFIQRQGINRLTMTPLLWPLEVSSKLVTEEFASFRATNLKLMSVFSSVVRS